MAEEIGGIVWNCAHLPLPPSFSFFLSPLSLSLFLGALSLSLSVLTSPRRRSDRRYLFSGVVRDVTFSSGRRRRRLSSRPSSL